MVIRKNKSGYKVYKTKSGEIKSVHQRVAEKKIGGPVRKGYEVHHRDGNKINNRPGNLSVIKRSTHKTIHAKKKK
ncbi:MAG: HNH endonuclease [Nanoarchaeota archaeon]|nr:HNH endonuclease [Nanoarchaeota archaeon]MBU1623103.1 HNH endonuclease [Nanoarchaeota archaeon]